MLRFGTGEADENKQEVGFEVEEKDLAIFLLFFSAHAHALYVWYIYACAGTAAKGATADRRAQKNVVSLSSERFSKAMSFVGRQESCVLEDPNAVRHMDALFDVLRKPSGNASSVVGGGSATCSAAAADLVHGGPGDVEFFLDALFSVVQHPTGGGERRATSSREKKQAAAKTWKERELPASFFNSGGSTDDCDKSTRDRGDGDRTQEKACQNEAPNSPQPRPPSSETKPQEITSPAGDRSGGVAPPLPVVLVANTNTTESLTFYIE